MCCSYLQTWQTCLNITTLHIEKMSHIFKIMTYIICAYFKKCYYFKYVMDMWQCYIQILCVMSAVRTQCRCKIFQFCKTGPKLEIFSTPFFISLLMQHFSHTSYNCENKYIYYQQCCRGSVNCEPAKANRLSRVSRLTWPIITEAVAAVSAIATV